MMNPFVLIMSSLSSAAASPQPIQLHTISRSGAVEVQVIGHSDVPSAARYRLVVSSGSSGNRSSQSGYARLQPGETTVLVRLRMSSGEEAQWSVQLFVEPEGAEPYERSALSGSPGR